MRQTSLHESLVRDRRHYERLVYGRLHTAISWEDAEDIVAEALFRATRAALTDPPEPGHHEGWFGRIVLNQGIDFIRSRDGRRRENSTARPTVVSIAELTEAGVELPEDPGIPPHQQMTIEDLLGEEAERHSTAALVERVLERLEPKEAELIKLRHLFGAERSREEIASMAGLSLGQFRARYAKAWRRFVRAVERDAPTGRCLRVRRLMGEIGAGTAASVAALEVDAHVLDCPSCRVFARESYRALELLPLAPCVGVAERWGARAGWWWERTNPEAAAGAGTAAAGVGLLGLLGGGSTGALKAVAILCSVTAVTAGICGGVAVMLGELGKPPPAKAKRIAAKPAATPTPKAASAATPRAAAHATTTATATPRAAQATAASRLNPNRKVPSTAPAGSSEFSPTSSTTKRDPAPVPTGVTSEFSP
jgi:RNA polymerase sigma factor (sigma-70 family)